jgi:anti-sigma factor RsiW
MSSAYSSDIERGLVDLRSRLAWPETPDLAPPVVARLVRPPARPPWVLRAGRVPAIAAAVVLVLLGSLAFPVTRDALADLLGVAGIEIRFGPRPEVESGGRPSPPGGVVSLAEARAAVDYEIGLPALGPPERVLLDRRAPGGAVTLSYRNGDLLMTQFRGGLDSELIEKVLGPGTRLHVVTVDGATGYWISGARHVVLYLTPAGAVREDRARLAGNTLVWEAGGVTHRLEADVSRREALRIARSVR